MESTGSGDGPLVPIERRELARDKAKQSREQRRKQQRRNRTVFRSLIAVVLVAAVAGVAFMLTSSAKPAPSGPRNMLSDGITIGEGLQAVPTRPLAAEQKPVPSEPIADDVIDIRVYVDYLCTHCAEFDEENNKQIAAWIQEGAASLEVHPLALLDSQSQGHQYSTRAANAAACVANYAPDSFFSFNSALLAAQPEDGQGSLDDEEILDVAKQVGAGGTPIADCIANQKFKSWVKAATVRALNGPIPNASIESVRVTPTILINGAKYNYAYPFDSKDLAQVMTQAIGSVYNKMSTQEPTPAPEQ